MTNRRLEDYTLEKMAFIEHIDRKMMNWRVSRYGKPCLTPAEVRTLEIERELRFAANGLSLFRYYQLETQLNLYWERQDADNVLVVRDAMLGELTHIETVKRGIITRVAERLGVSQPTISIRLKRASAIMKYLTLIDNASYGWRQGDDGQWWLAVPVAPIDEKTRHLQQKNMIPLGVQSIL